MFVACSPSASDLEVETSGDDIIDGQVTTDYPAVVQLRMPRWVCSGTIISGDRVLTAGHCLVDEGGSLVSAVRIVGGATADAWAAHPNYNPSDLSPQGAGSDIGVVHFPTSLGGGLPIGAAPEVGTNVRLVGYGLYNLNQGIDGQKRTAINRVSAVSGNYLEHRGTNNVCSGDSGGAVLSVDGQQIVGVISRGEVGCAGNSHSGLPSASAAWIAGAPASTGDDGGGSNGATPDYPVYTVGGLEAERGPTDVEGVCVDVQGPTKRSTGVKVFRDGAFIETVENTVSRADFRADVERRYKEQGFPEVKMPDDKFGFKYTLTVAGRYEFTCADSVIGERTLAQSKYPIFTGGHVDDVGGPDEVNGWCAVVTGSAKQSTEVRVFRNGNFQEAIQATEIREDVSEYIEKWYAELGFGAVQMPDDVFGFKYNLTQNGRYEFQCANTVIGEKTKVGADYPIFAEGNVDNVGGPTEVNGWCAVVKGPVVQSTEVRIFRNGIFQDTIEATEIRGDVSEHIEAWYANLGFGGVQMPNDVFGFKYDLVENGRYEFRCANVVIGEKTKVGTDYPIFAGGYVDNVGGPTEVNGWCAIVKGPVVQSTEVRVLRDGVFQQNLYATEARDDVRDHIEAWYATNGHADVTLPNDTFGFKYTLGTPGRYEFRCANVVIGEKTLAPPEYPVFTGGNVDQVGGPDEVNGWCATVRGSTVESTEVRITRNGIYLGTIRATANRPDVTDHIEAWYQGQGYDVQMPNDRFGFYYTLNGPGRYVFTCAGTQIGEKTLTPPDYPIFAGGNVDAVGGPTEVNGWCAIVKGPVVQSTEVRVLRNGQFVTNIYASARRDDVSDHIEAWYDAHGYSEVTMPTDVFGFYYTLSGSGTYTFQCAGMEIGSKTL
ncbi:MAG: trypsin-like serine protease [Deltaproteobacteria bacterium]|nr:trypsin-like serine protease [Deltaproteobacteria bacterium]